MLEKTKILIVLGELDMGGAQRQALQLAQHLKTSEGAQVEVLGMTGKAGRAADICDELGIPWRSIRCPWPERGKLRTLSCVVEYARVLRNAKPDIVLPYALHANVYCGAVWRWSGARTCIWNQREDGRGRQPGRIEYWAVKQTPAFVSNSQAGAEYLVQTLRADPERVNIVRNGLQLAAPKAEPSCWRKRLGVTEDCFLACMVANLHRFKDHETVLRAWCLVTERMAEAGRSAVLLLAGRFDDTHQPLKALAHNLDLGGSVRFLGSVDDVTGLLGCADIGVFSSHSEGVSNGVLECMATGLAVAGTDIPGIREAIAPEGFCLLCPAGDHSALADRILAIAWDPALRKRLGEANRQRAIHDFSAEQMFRKMVAIIESTMNSR